MSARIVAASLGVLAFGALAATPAMAFDKVKWEQPTYNPTTAGNYYVVVMDICGKAKSDVITVCGKPQLVIKAPCCVCPGEPPITLEAIVLWTPSNCPQSCTYLWNTGATTSSISVTLPGTYTVTVSCGTCPPMTQSVTIKPCL